MINKIYAAVHELNIPNLLYTTLKLSVARPSGQENFSFSHQSQKAFETVLGSGWTYFVQDRLSGCTSLQISLIYPCTLHVHTHCSLG